MTKWAQRISQFYRLVCVSVRLCVCMSVCRRARLSSHDEHGAFLQPYYSDRKQDGPTGVILVCCWAFSRRHRLSCCHHCACSRCPCLCVYVWVCMRMCAFVRAWVLQSVARLALPLILQYRAPKVSFADLVEKCVNSLSISNDGRLPNARPHSIAMDRGLWGRAPAP